MKISKFIISGIFFSCLIILCGMIFQNSKLYKLELSEIQTIEALNTKIQEKIKEKRKQEKFIKETKYIWGKIKNNVEESIWNVYNDIRITPLGAISAAKLKGVDEVNKYLETRGKYNPKDKNGDELSKFFSLDAGDSYPEITGVEYKNIAYNVYKIIDWQKNSNIKASDILYNYLLENEKDLDIKKELGGSEKRRIIASFADLNDDGQNEIIGYIMHIYYSSEFMSEFNIFILEKQANGKYKNISDMSTIGILEPLYILNSKNEGYKNLFFYGSGRNDVNQYNLKYKNGFYSYDFDAYLTKNHRENLNKIRF